jgi:hypothetical protein
MPTGGRGISQQGTFLEGDTGAVLETIESKLRQCVSVKDFGAKGDTVTDDTAAIQAALTASLYVYFPVGTYVVTNLTLQANQTIFGVGRSTVISVKAGQTGNVFSFVGSGAYPYGYAFIKVADMEIFGNGNNGGSGAAFNFGNAFGFYMSNVIVDSCFNAVKADNFQNLQLNNCRLTSGSGYGIRATRSDALALNPWLGVTDSFIDGNTLGGIYASDTAGVSLNNVKILTNHDTAVQVDRTTSFTQTFCHILACDFDTNWNAGIRILDTQEVVIKGTWISSGRTSSGTSTNAAGQGIYLSNVFYASLIGNQIYDEGGNGIELRGTSKNINIIGNTIVGCGGDNACILGAAGNNVSVIGNSLLPSDAHTHLTATSGVWITAGDYHQVIGNQISGFSGFDWSVNGNNSKVLGNASSSTTTETFNTSNNYQWNVIGTGSATLDGAVFKPVTDTAVSLGTSSQRFANIEALRITGGWGSSNVANGGTFTHNAALGNVARFNAQGATMTIAAPSNARTGQMLTLIGQNTSGGATTMTWNVIFKMAAWTNPATGFSASTTFAYDGTNWIQVSPQTTAVPN